MDAPFTTMSGADVVSSDLAEMETSVRVSVPDVAEMREHCKVDSVSRLNAIDVNVTDDPSMMNTAVDDSLVSAETVFVTLPDSDWSAYVVD